MIHANTPGPRPWRARMRFAYLEPETLTYLAIPGVALTASAIQTLNTNIQTIKGGGSVSLAGTTGRLATVALGAFIDAPSVDLRAYRGFKATFTAGGKTAVCLIGGNGTAEAMTEQLADTGFDNAGSWTANAGWTVNPGSSGKAEAVAAAAGTFLYQDIAESAGVLLRGTYTCSDYTGGNFGLVFGPGVVGGTKAATGTFTEYKTRAGETKMGLYVPSNALTAKFTQCSVSRVTAPSALGSLLYKLDGTTRSFESNDGLNPNTAWDIAIAKV